MAPNNGYIYAIITREFINSKQSIIKIGKTKNIIQRCKDYPKGSLILFSKLVIDDHITENIVQHELAKKFNVRNDIGNEYFEGLSDHIVDTIENTIKNIEYDYNKNKCGNRCFDDEFQTFIFPIKNKNKQACSYELSLIKQFYLENEVQYHKKIVSSQTVYQHFLNWLLQNQLHQIQISHKAFTIGLKDMFFITSKYHRFSEGVFLALCFGDTQHFDYNNSHEFTKNHIQITDNLSDFITMKQINDLFKQSKFYNGKILHSCDIEQELQKKCIRDKMINKKKYKNVFLGCKPYII